MSHSHSQQFRQSCNNDTKSLNTTQKNYNYKLEFLPCHELAHYEETKTRRKCILNHKKSMFAAKL